MADFFLDVSAVGNEYQTWAATPTWGSGASDKPLPMDGNGLAGPGHAAAVAIAEIQITVLPADGNTLAVAGATLTAKTTAAAKNQWTITGAISTCVTNLVALLNTPGTGTAQCDAAVSSTACALSLALPYWQFARVKPGTTDTIQLATRVAGSNLNHATNTAVAIATSGWGTPPTITQFVGGSNGPFAWWMNHVNHGTIFGKAVHTYGIAIAASAGPTEPTSTDPIYARTARSGSDLAWVYDNGAASAGHTLTVAVGRLFVFDDGTQWSGDAGQFAWRVRYGHSSSAFSLSLTFTDSYRLVSADDGMRGHIEFVSQYAGSGANAFQFRVLGSAAYQEFDGLQISKTDGLTSSTNATVAFGMCTQTTGRFSYRNNLVEWNSSFSLCPHSSGTVAMDGAYVGNTFSISGLSAPWTMNFCGGAPSSLLVAFNYNTIVDADGGGFKCTNLFSGAIACAKTLIEAIGNVGLEDAAPGFTGTANVVQCCVFVKPDADRSSRVSHSYFSTAYDAAASPVFPTRNSVNLAGNPYSQRVTTSTNPGGRLPVCVFRSSRIKAGADAVETVALQLLTDDADAWTTGQLYMDVQYTTAAGARVLESTREADWAATGLSAGDGGWSNVPSGFSSEKLSLTTTNSVKEDTEIVVSVYFYRSITTNFYLDPEIEL